MAASLIGPWLRSDATIRDIQSGNVIENDNKSRLTMLCPCSQRVISVTSPPHAWEWSDDGKLDLNGSVGHPETDNPPRPSNWCHFSISKGWSFMHGDARCPGATGEES